MKRWVDVTPHLEPERAFLVGVRLPSGSVAEEREHLDELAQLATTAGADVVGSTVQSRTRVDGATYIGSGKADAIKRACDEVRANLLVFDNDLSPAQARNLEALLGVRIIDRTELILDIFARHARTNQAKIQVELAQLEYALPRLTRMWEHLSRQAGGIGTRGPGETQLEVDRRRVHQRMASLRRQLKKIETRRETLRRSRNGIPKIALIGYTNAGKSTLMRQLTGADAFVEDRLFATLDTMTRSFTTERHGDVFVIDTVGFIRKLPDHLVTSFKATLADTAQADLYIHVVDVAHPQFLEQMDVTDTTVRSIPGGDTDTIYVFNKIDRLPPDELEGLRCRHGDAVFISAQDGVGIDALRARIEDFFFGTNVRVEVKIPAGDGAAVAAIRRLLHEARDSYEDDVCVLSGTIDTTQMGRLESVSGARVRYLF